MIQESKVRSLAQALRMSVAHDAVAGSEADKATCDRQMGAAAVMLLELLSEAGLHRAEGYTEGYEQGVEEERARHLAAAHAEAQSQKPASEEPADD